MGEDYYHTLEVSRSSSQEEIQKAYRKLARKYHPDLNPDDKTAKEKFQKVQAAFDVLNDPKKRELYDRYGSSFESMGAGGPGGGRTTWSSTGQPGGTAEDVDFSQFFGERFGADPSGGFADIFRQFRRAGAGGTARRPGPTAGTRGADITHTLPVPFVTSILGGEAQVQVHRSSGKMETISVKIPAGIEDGKKIRLRGQGEPSPLGGPPGDILITIKVQPHACFERRGKNLHVVVPVSLAEAVLGAKVDVPTPKGTVSLRVPPETSSGTKLRIKGLGVAPAKGEPGNLFAEIQVVLPKGLDEKSRDAVRDLDKSHPVQPRTNLRW